MTKNRYNYQKPITFQNIDKKLKTFDEEAFQNAGTTIGRYHDNSKIVKPCK